jgi:hypothetical protein
MQLLMHVRREQFVARVGEAHIQGQDRERVIDGALLDDHVVGERVLLQVVLREQLLEPGFGGALALGAMRQIDRDRLRAGRGCGDGRKQQCQERPRVSSHAFTFDLQFTRALLALGLFTIGAQPQRQSRNFFPLRLIRDPIAKFFQRRAGGSSSAEVSVAPRLLYPGL